MLKFLNPRYLLNLIDRWENPNYPASPGRRFAANLVLAARYVLAIMATSVAMYGLVVAINAANAFVKIGISVVLVIVVSAAWVEGARHPYD